MTDTTHVNTTQGNKDRIPTSTRLTRAERLELRSWAVSRGHGPQISDALRAAVHEVLAA